MNKKIGFQFLVSILMVGTGLVFISRNNLGIPSVHAAEELNLSANLFSGSRGQNVSKLQNFLKDQGVYSGPVTGYFGPLTKRAVIVFQKQNGIAPAAGFVGPVTRTFILRTTTGTQNVYPSASPSQYQYQSPSASGSPSPSSYSFQMGQSQFQQDSFTNAWSTFLPPYSYPSPSPESSSSTEITSKIYIETAFFPDGVVNQPYAASLQAIGGSGNYQWSLISGTLPPGLTLQNNFPCTGNGICPMIMIRPLLSGVPDVAGQYSFTLQVTDSNDDNNQASQSYSIDIASNTPTPTVTPIPTIIPPPTPSMVPPPTIPPPTPTTTPIPTPTMVPSLGVSATISLDYPYKTTVTWPNSLTQIVTSVGNPFFPRAIVGQPYQITFSGLGLGMGGSCSANNGIQAINNGLTLSQGGVLSGIPKKTGYFILGFNCYSGGQAGVNRQFNTQINVVNSIEDTLIIVNSDGSTASGGALRTDASNGFSDFLVGTYGTATLHAAGGTGNYTWSFVPPTRSKPSDIPPGMSLSSDGVISGTPAQISPNKYYYSFRVQLSDGVSTLQALYRMYVDPIKETITRSINNFPIKVCSPLQYGIGKAEAGSKDSFSVTSGSLPPGFRIERFSTGVSQSGGLACFAQGSQFPCTTYQYEIVGIPKVPGSYNFTITRSSDGGAVQYTLNIPNAPEWGPNYDCGANLSIETKILLPATVGVPYFAVIQLSDAGGQFRFQTNFNNFPSGLTISKTNPNTGKEDPNQLYVYGTPGIPSNMKTAPTYPYTGGSVRLWVQSYVMGGVGQYATIPIVLNGPTR